jgi:hypothetical protein
MYGVQDDAERFTLTAEEVQNGDFVYVEDTNLMYLVVDDTQLNSEAGYKPLAAGIAAKAVGDEDGNNIKATYLKKSDASYVPLDTNNTYGTINGIRLYLSHIAPTGDIPDGSVGVGW